MSISLGGKTLTKPPAPERSIEELSHDAFACFDAMASMLMVRGDVIPLWTRMQKLHAKIDANPNHPNAPIANERIFRLREQIIEKQTKFLELERHANGYWQRISKKEREKEGLDTMFGVSSQEEAILGLWRRVLGEVKESVPPDGCHIEGTCLLFVPASQAEAYRKQRMKG